MEDMGCRCLFDDGQVENRLDWLIDHHCWSIMIVDNEKVVAFQEFF
jgi:hypothetical protein